MRGALSRKNLSFYNYFFALARTSSPDFARRMTLSPYLTSGSRRGRGLNPTSRPGFPLYHALLQQLQTTKSPTCIAWLLQLVFPEHDKVGTVPPVNVKGFFLCVAMHLCACPDDCAKAMIRSWVFCQIFSLLVCYYVTYLHD